MDITEALDFIRTHHKCVLATVRKDGEPQLSPVSCSVDDDGYVVISTRETAAKTKNLRRDRRASLCVLSENFFGPFVQVEGSVEIIDLPEAMEGLVSYYRSISGEHPDWDDYRQAMVREQRVLVRIRPTRAGPNVSG